MSVVEYRLCGAIYGPVVQLVRTLACHARGRRFEPVPGRHFKFYAAVARRQSTSLVRMRSRVRIASALHSKSGLESRFLLFIQSNLPNITCEVYMNQKELNEIRRRLAPNKNSISRINGCYVSSSKEIISYLDESLG